MWVYREKPSLHILIPVDGDTGQGKQNLCLLASSKETCWEGRVGRKELQLWVWQPGKSSLKSSFWVKVQEGVRKSVCDTD